MRYVFYFSEVDRELVKGEKLILVDFLQKGNVFKTDSLVITICRGLFEVEDSAETGTNEFVNLSIVEN